MPGGEPWLQKRYYDTSPGQAALSRFLPPVGAGIAEDLVFRAGAKFRFIAGARPQTSANTVFMSVYGLHYPSTGSRTGLDYRQKRSLLSIRRVLIAMLENTIGARTGA